jgi:site-specific recombinase XerD
MTLLAPHVTAYLRERLAVERGASPRTCDTYAYAFKLLLEYASRRFHCSPSALQLEQLDGPFVIDFLRHLSVDRQNGATSRNLRLSVVKSFMRFVEHRVPSALDQVHRVLAVPPHKTARRVVRHLQPDEYQALLKAPSAASRLGVRDRALLHVALAGGLRASELVGLRLEDVRFRDGYVELTVLGKGRRERVLLLWKEVGRSIRQWLAVRGHADVPEVFITARGGMMTRAGLEYIIIKHANAAAALAPSLAGKRVSPHVLRHTCAINMLRATGDTRKVALWLGHATSATTDAFYLPADPTEKLEALMAVQPPLLPPGRYRPLDALIASLRPVAKAGGGRAAEAVHAKKSHRR